MPRPSRDVPLWFGAGAALLFTFLISIGLAGAGLSGQAAKPVARQPARRHPPRRGHPRSPRRWSSTTRSRSGSNRRRRPASPASSKKSADNSSCLVCHANFRKEGLAATHASNAVGCTSCHGPSIAHRNDEANIIPPDFMFPTESIDVSCARCHESHDVEPAAVVKRFLEKCPKPTDLKSLVCTSCHGEHRMAVRTVRWDRKTRKLVSAAKP